MARAHFKENDQNPCPDCATENRSGSTFCIACGARLTGRETGALAGHRIGAWKVVRLLGRGGMGEVYLARKKIGTRGEFDSVLKVPHTRNLDTETREGLIVRILEEAEVLRNLSHSHIVPFQDVFAYLGGIVLSMRYIEGTDLATLIATNCHLTEGQLPWPRVRRWTVAILNALHFAHVHPLRPIVHGDVKPSNIRIEKNSDTAWLLDFGLATVMRSGDPSPGPGTLAYAAPEVLCSKAATPQADMFSLAATLYETLCGQLPYPAGNCKTSAEQVEFMVKHQPVPLAEYRPDIPPPVSHAIHRALSLVPERRFDDCEEFSQALSRASTMVRSGTAGSGPQKRTPGTRFGLYKLKRKAAQMPLWETWFATEEERGETVWLTVFHDPRTWPFLGALRNQPWSGEESYVRPIYTMDSSFQPPYIVHRADPQERLLGEILVSDELAVEDAFACAIQILRGLRGLHHRGQVHALISPHSVCVQPQIGRAVILHAGLWSVLEWVVRQATVESRGELLSAYPYLAPELLDPGEATPRCDVYSVGKLLVRLLGRRLHIDDCTSLLQGHGIEPDVINALVACFARDPEQRPGNSDLLLHEVLEASGLDTYTPGESRFLSDAEAAIEQGKPGNAFSVFEYGHATYGIGDQRAVELLHSLVDRLGAECWARFVEPYRQSFLPILEEQMDDGLLTEEARIRVETVRQERRVPSLLARYLECTLRATDFLVGGIPCVWIPRGSFTMGDDRHRRDERPSRTVTLDAFFIARRPVTREQYARFCTETNHTAPAFPELTDELGPDCPVSGISYVDAIFFCKWLSARTGMKVELPSEAQWEYAAAGSVGSRYPWGESPPDQTRCLFGDVDGQPLPVGQLPGGESKSGLYDMAGGVWEWCRDWYNEIYYWEGPVTNPYGPATGEKRVLRGGSYMSPLERLRCAARDKDSPDVPLPSYGFRIVVESDW